MGFAGGGQDRNEADDFVVGGLMPFSLTSPAPSGYPGGLPKLSPQRNLRVHFRTSLVLLRVPAFGVRWRWARRIATGDFVPCFSGILIQVL